jgi:hypothetical protein
MEYSSRCSRWIAFCSPFRSCFIHYVHVYWLKQLTEIAPTRLLGCKIGHTYFEAAGIWQ